MNERKKISNFGIIGLFFVLAFWSIFVAQSAEAEQYTSDSYKVDNPVIFSGGFSSSDSFRLISVISQLATGTSTATSYNVQSGFLYFPVITTPTVTAVSGDGQVALSWTASTGYLGWSAGSYAVGRSTASGGSYAFTNVGSARSATQSGLTNNTAYYFVVQVLDTLGNTIATSTEVSATPAAASSQSSNTATGGGGGILPSGGKVIFRGRAYPGSEVVILKDGQIIVKAPAGPDSKFELSLSNLSSGSFMFSLYSKDSQGRLSSFQSFPITLSSGASATIGGIFFSPTIGIDKTKVKRGDNIILFGQTAQNATVTLAVSSEQKFFAFTKAHSDGSYLYYFDTAPLDIGKHQVEGKAVMDGEISPFSNALAFEISKTAAIQELPLPDKKIEKHCASEGDLNGDCRVNLVDFSILTYWHKRPLSPAFIEIENNHLSGDGAVNLTDFSILAYYWTG